MNDERYGEVKFRKRIGPAIAKEIVEKGSIDIVVTTGKISEKTRGIFEEGGITVYNPSKEKVYEVLEKLNEKKNEEKKEYICI